MLRNSKINIIKNSIFLFFTVILCISCKTGLNLERINIFFTGNPTNVEDKTASFIGQIVDLSNKSEVTEHGHCWAKTANPTVLDSTTALGPALTPGTFRSDLPDLESLTPYFVRAYYVTEKGTFYGNEVNFSTKVDKNLPFVTNIAVYNITISTAIAEGGFQSVGIYPVLSFGHCWANAPNPTIANSKSNLGTNPSASNTFESNISALNPGTVYYVRSYIQINNTASGAVETYYGSEISFITAN